MMTTFGNLSNFKRFDFASFMKLPTLICCTQLLFNSKLNCLPSADRNPNIWLVVSNLFFWEPSPDAWVEIKVMLHMRFQHPQLGPHMHFKHGQFEPEIWSRFCDALFAFKIEKNVCYCTCCICRAKILILPAKWGHFCKVVSIWLLHTLPKDRLSI